MPSLKIIAANTFYQLLARLSSSVTGFFIAILIAKILGVNGYGEYAKVTAYIGLFYLFVDFGANAIFLKNGRSWTGQDFDFGELTIFRIILSFIIWVFAFMLSFFLPVSTGIGGGFSFVEHIGIFIFSGTLITEGLLYSASAKFQKNLSYGRLAAAVAIGSAVTFLGVLFVLWQHLSVLGIFVSFLLGSSAKAGAALFLSRISFLQTRINSRFVKYMLKESGFVAGMLIANMIYFRIDMIMLSFMRSTSDVAQYDFAYKFFDFLIALPLYISNTLYPSFIEKANNSVLKTKNNVNEFSEIFNQAVIFAGIGVIVAIGVFICAPLLVIIRQEFIGSVTTLRILSVFLPVFFTTNVLQWILIARGEQKFLLLVYSLGAGINILLNAVYIPQFSFIGASWITGASETLVLGALIIKIANISNVKSQSSKPKLKS